jgi:hypothetical protein
MSYHFEFESTNRILRIWFEGHLTDEDLKEYYLVVRKYVARTDPSAAILDMSAVTTVQLSPETVRELAASPPTIPQPARPRFIVAPSPPIFGFSRMFELEGAATRPNLHVVRSLKDVWAILGIQELKFEPLEIE